jgi:hypothetical protein
LQPRLLLCCTAAAAAAAATASSSFFALLCDQAIILEENALLPALCYMHALNLRSERMLRLAKAVLKSSSAIMMAVMRELEGLSY